MTHHLPAQAHRAGKASAAIRSGRAQRRAIALAPVIADLRSEGATSLRTLAARLTAAGIPAPGAPTWSHVAVLRVLARIELGSKAQQLSCANGL